MKSEGLTHNTKTIQLEIFLNLSHIYLLSGVPGAYPPGGALPDAGGPRRAQHNDWEVYKEVDL